MPVENPKSTKTGKITCGHPKGGYFQGCDIDLNRINRLHDYWCNPDSVNSPLAYITSSNAKRRSGAFVSVIKKLFPDRNISILELGSGTGRNLYYLKKAGYENITGVELSPLYIAAMKEHFPQLSEMVIQGPLEEILPVCNRSYDLVFSMAVLEHIPTESENVFSEIVRIAKNLIVIEDEKCKSWRHFPRNYRDVFSGLGMEYVKGWKNVPGLSSSFVMRFFQSSRC